MVGHPGANHQVFDRPFDAEVFEKGCFGACEKVKRCWLSLWTVAPSLLCEGGTPGAGRLRKLPVDVSDQISYEFVCHTNKGEGTHSS